MCTCTAHAARGCIGISLAVATACREQLHPCHVRKSGQCTCKVQAESHCSASRYMRVCTAVGVSLTKGYASCAMRPVQWKGLQNVTWFHGKRLYVCLFVCVCLCLRLICLCVVCLFVSVCVCSVACLFVVCPVHVYARVCDMFFVLPACSSCLFL